MTIQDFAMVCPFVLIAFMSSALARALWKQREFHKYLAQSRQKQILAHDSFIAGNPQKADVLLSAAQEDLDRAKMFL